MNSPDILSDVLHSVRLRGGVYFRCQASAPWGMEIRPTPVAEFHVVTRGRCWLRMTDRTTSIPLQAGDLVVFPHGAAHTLGDTPDAPAVAAEAIIGDQLIEGFGPVVFGGSGPQVELLCGYFDYERDRKHPLIAALPPLIHLPVGNDREFAWLRATLEFMTQETRDADAGVEAVISRLSEVLFIQVVRAYVRQQALKGGAIIAVLAHRRIGAALSRMHSDPAREWTLEALASDIGMSRSAFAKEFAAVVGRTPMQYLADWRMEKAREMLATTRDSTVAIAEAVGYRSEAAFARSFKKVSGCGPGAFRRNASGRKSLR